MDPKVDYINDNFRQLVQEGRIRDAVKFCEKQASGKTCVEFQCLALRNLVMCHFYYTGDGQAFRETSLRAISLLDSRKDILKEDRSQYMSFETIKNLYSWFCKQLSLAALTAAEFAKYSEKPSSVRELTSEDKNAIRYGTEMKSKKDDWKDFKLAAFEVLLQDSQTKDRNISPAQIACLGMLYIKERAVLCLKPNDLNTILPKYTESVVSSINMILQECESNKMAPEESQLAFIINRASDEINKLRNDQRTDTKIVNACMKTLRECKAQLAKTCFDPKAKAKLERLKKSKTYVTLEGIKEE